MVTITCKIPEAVHARLDSLARTRRISKSRVVRAALEGLLNRRGAARQRQAFDLVAHLAGSLRGPKDLASHPRHLDDLGA